jgi:glycosyltransferase involved in cell wall biosynthesis
MNATYQRILFAHFPSDLYGAGRSLVRLIGALPRERFEAFVLLARDGPLRAELEAAGARVILHRWLGVIERRRLAPHRLMLLLAQSLISVAVLTVMFRRLRVDLVHTNTGIVFSPAIAARLARIPHVWHIRDWFGEFSWIWRWYSMMIVYLSRCVVCVSEAMAHQFPVDGPVRVVYNGLDSQQYVSWSTPSLPGMRASWGLGDDPVIGTVGRIKLGRKGQEVLVRAAALLKMRGQRFHVLIVGGTYSGNEAHLQQLQDLVGELGLMQEIVFAGELPDVRPAYEAMDLFVLPSGTPEPFGGVVLEAMAMGKPVVATAIGGTAEQVVNGITGILVPPMDAESMADALHRLCVSPELRASMGAAGRERVFSTFALERTVKQIVSLYDAIAPALQGTVNTRRHP